jgi:hypothetical protein
MLYFFLPFPLHGIGSQKSEFDNLKTNKALFESSDPIYCAKSVFLVIEITWYLTLLFLSKVEKLGLGSLGRNFCCIFLNKIYKIKLSIE